MKDISELMDRLMSLLEQQSAVAMTANRPYHPTAIVYAGMESWEAKKDIEQTLCSVWRARADAICHFALLRGPITLARDSALGDDLSVPVIVLDQDGYAEATVSEKASFPVEQEYEIKAEEGTFTVLDYASAGQSWKQDMPITVWIKTKA